MIRRGLEPKQIKIECRAQAGTGLWASSSGLSLACLFGQNVYFVFFVEKGAKEWESKTTSECVRRMQQSEGIEKKKSGRQPDKVDGDGCVGGMFLCEVFPSDGVS